jgi:hypothetical protein
MPSSFVAYIDESGDEGFSFLPDERGSSRWFVLSAVVFRGSSKPEPVQVMRDVRGILNRAPKQAVHFRYLKHEQRVAYISRLARARARIVSVLVYKEGIGEPERYQSTKYMLYRYATRLLLERISWLCRDHRKPVDGDGSAKLVFSNRSAMSYDQLRDYLLLLRERSVVEDIRVDWGVINPDKVTAVNHEQLAGLQIADAVASSLFFAVNRGPYGFVEPRYAIELAARFYRYKGRLLGYGVKLWPDLLTCKKEMPHVAAFEKM